MSKSTVARLLGLSMRVAQAEDEEAPSGGKGNPGGKWVEFMKEVGDKKVKNPDTGNTVKMKSLKGEKGKKLLQREFEKWRKQQERKEKGGKGKSKGKKEEGTKGTGTSLKKPDKWDSMNEDEKMRSVAKAVKKHLKLKSKGTEDENMDEYTKVMDFMKDEMGIDEKEVEDLATRGLQDYIDPLFDWEFTD